VYVKPYTILRPLGKADDFMMLENACHEGNYGMTGLLSGGRANEKEALTAAEAELETRRQPAPPQTLTSAPDLCKVGKALWHRLR
jgi:hypothetical protein